MPTTLVVTSIGKWPRPSISAGEGVVNNLGPSSHLYIRRLCKKNNDCCHWSWTQGEDKWCSLKTTKVTVEPGRESGHISGSKICTNQLVHYLASFVQQNSKIGGHSNPFGGSSITYVGSVCHQSRVIWSWGAHSALTSWSRWFYTVKWSKLAIFSGLSGRFLGVVWWFQSFLQVRTCPYLDDPEKFWKKI